MTNKEEKEGTSSGECRTQRGLECASCPRLRRPLFPETRLCRWALLSSASPLCGSQLSAQTPVWLLWGNIGPRNKCNSNHPGLCGQGTFSCSGRMEPEVSFAFRQDYLPLGQRYQKGGSKDFLATSLSQNCRRQDLPVSYLRSLMLQSLPTEGPQRYLAPSLLLEKSFSSSDLK